MSLNTLKIATDGYLKRQTKAVFIIAVAGYLNFTDVPPIPPTPPSGGGGAGNPYVKSYEKDELEKRKDRIKRNEQEWLLFIKIYTEQCL